MTTDNGGAAFPAIQTMGRDFQFVADGMTLLDYFAGQALAGMTANAAALESCSHAADHDPPKVFALLAELCYAKAAALIAERQKRMT